MERMVERKRLVKREGKERMVEGQKDRWIEGLGEVERRDRRNKERERLRNGEKRNKGR